jgi:hypothetical protein
MPKPRPTLFKWRHFEPEIIICAVRWYLRRFSLSYRDVEELLVERGLPADHTSVWRWVQRYAPELNKRCRRELKQMSRFEGNSVPQAYSPPRSRISCSVSRHSRTGSLHRSLRFRCGLRLLHTSLSLDPQRRECSAWLPAPVHDCFRLPGVITNAIHSEGGRNHVLLRRRRLCVFPYS